MEFNYAIYFNFTAAFQSKIFNNFELINFDTIYLLMSNDYINLLDY